MRDHHHLLGSADDAEQFDGLNMRCGIDDHDVGQWRRIGDGRKRGRSRNENRLRRGENLRMLLMQAVQRNITGAGKRGMQQIGSCVRENSMSHRRRMDSCATIGPTERTCSTSTWANRSAAPCNADPS